MDKGKFTAVLTTWYGKRARGSFQEDAAGNLELHKADKTVTLTCAALSDTQSLAQFRQEAWNMVSRVTAAAGGITAVCFEEKPQTDIPVRLEVLG